MCELPDVLSSLYPARNCMICATKKAAAQLLVLVIYTCEQKSPIDIIRRELFMRAMRSRTYKTRPTCIIHAVINLNNQQSISRRAAFELLLTTFLCMLAMACSMFTNHNAYTTYKTYESFSSSSVSNSMMETLPSYQTPATIIQSQNPQAALHKPQCRYSYTLPSQALNAASPTGNILSTHPVFDPELEVRAKQLQELER